MVGYFITRLLSSLLVKDFGKLVNIWKVMGKSTVSCFLTRGYIMTDIKVYVESPLCVLFRCKYRPKPDV